MVLVPDLIYETLKQLPLSSLFKVKALHRFWKDIEIESYLNSLKEGFTAGEVWFIDVPLRFFLSNDKIRFFVIDDPPSLQKVRLELKGLFGMSAGVAYLEEFKLPENTYSREVVRAWNLNPA